MSVEVVEEMQTVVDKTRSAMGVNFKLYYMFGHPLEIVSRLQEMSASPKSKDKKYPLIALFTDIAVDRNDPVGTFGRAKLNLIIATLTEPSYTASDRLEKHFKPILQPIKEELLEQVSKHIQFTFEEMPTYTEIERYYWGRGGLFGNSANIFNDRIDCIEIQNLEVIIKNKICSTAHKNF